MSGVLRGYDVRLLEDGEGPEGDVLEVAYRGGDYVKSALQCLRLPLKPLSHAMWLCSSSIILSTALLSLTAALRPT